MHNPIDLGHFNSVRNSPLRNYPTDQRDLSLLLAVLSAFVFCLIVWAVETGPVRAEHAYQMEKV